MKSGTIFNSRIFLIELIIDILLFAILCGCSLMIFSKSTDLSTDSTTLQQSVTICSNIAAIYQRGEQDFDSLEKHYPESLQSEDGLVIFFNDKYQICSSGDETYTVLVQIVSDNYDKVIVTFFDENGDKIYQIPVCRYVPGTVDETQGGAFHE